jgi:sugar lactone lactonase YvrE
VLTTLLDGLTFTEGPRWHDGRLWFSDFYSQRVLATTPDGKVPRKASP